MKLKKLVLYGFKSFADKTTFDFVPGITVIVGPNGCGKSNISDGFRWALGEQSAKSLRGGNMLDVIFSGTTSRKPLNMAEVTIHATDMEGQLPYHEIAISRRLHRSGESHYLLNQQPVRLCDIQELFLDSGIGKSAFSIFEQGKIDQIINFNPKERRLIFEEAAGILRFLQKKRESMRKLEHTDQNLLRLHDIYTEVESRIETLEKQAERAKAYKEHQKNLEQLEMGTLAERWRSAEKSLHHILQEEAKLTCLYDEKTEEIKSQKNRTSDDLKKAGELDRQLLAARESLYLKRGQKQAKLQEADSCLQRINEEDKKQARWQSERAALELKLKSWQKEQEGAHLAMSGIEEAQKSAEADLRAAQDMTHKAEEALAKGRAAHQRGQEEHVERMRAENRIESAFKEMAIRIEAIEERHNRNERRLIQLKEASDEQSKTQKEKQATYAEQAEIIQKLKNEREMLGTELLEINKSSLRMDVEATKLKSMLIEHEARQKALVRLREDMEGLSKGCRRLLQESRKKISPIYGLLLGLYEVVQLQGETEGIAAEVLKRYAETLVVKTECDLLSVLHFVQKEKISDFSLICEELCKAPSLESELARALNDHPLSRRLLGDVFPVKTVEEAIRGAKESKDACFVTDDGFFIDERGLLYSLQSGGSNVFSREAEIRTLTDQIESIHVNLSEKKEELRIVKEKKSALEKKGEDLDGAAKEAEMEHLETRYALQRIEADVSLFLREQEQIESTCKELLEERRCLEEQQKELKEKKAHAKESAHSMQIEVEALLKQTQQAELTANHARLALAEKERLFSGVEDTYKKLQYDINLYEVKILESCESGKRLDEDMATSYQFQKDRKERQTELLKQTEALAKEIETDEMSIHAVADKIASAKCAAAAKEEALEIMRQQEHELTRQLHELGLEKERRLQTKETCALQLWDRYEIDSDLVKQIPSLTITIDQAERQIRKHRRQMEEAGNVNMTSIEEFEEQKQRRVFLSSQIEDLESSKNELLQIIEQLDSKSKELFDNTFRQVRENFKKNFGILFQGGEADLAFTESGDILEAGIEITAKPPGKKMRSIQLLSGGEKCLTAMALLFAIFEVRPAPFCILDEIDAPLDDTNVDRFLNVVKQFVDQCQFIIITHNKRTMAIADRLFGVSMQEKGVSRLLSMEFKKEAHPIPELIEA